MFFAYNYAFRAFRRFYDRLLVDRTYRMNIDHMARYSALLELLRGCERGLHEYPACYQSYVLASAQNLGLPELETALIIDRRYLRPPSLI
jgi:hypothetical protein